MNWSHGDNLLAQRESWALFSANGELQLQRIDDEDTFPNDDAAWLHVWRRARQGSEIHVRALAHLRLHSNVEYDRIFDYCTAMTAKELQ